MPFIRLSDNYIDHPKFMALSDGAFRLWHEGMAYARKHQTDGLIPFGALKGFRYHTKGRERALSTPYAEGKNALWSLVPAFGYLVHDYLFWNLSKEEEQADRDSATERMRRLRKARKESLCSGEQGGERSANVQDRTGSDLSFRGKGSGGRGRFKWVCPHVDPCGNSTTCQIATELGRPRKAS